MLSTSASEIALRAQDHIRSLVYGLDPRTQQPIVDLDVLADAGVLRSLVFALEVLEQRDGGAFAEKKHGSRAGAPWNKAEDEQLLSMFKAGTSLDELMRQHERGNGGILSRLVVLEAVASRDEARTIFHRRKQQHPDGVCTRETRLGAE